MSRWLNVALEDVAEIERDIIEASAIEDGTLYVGLENIQSGGELIGVGPVNTGELASSKFVFSPRHLLYSKLRPYLAKVARPDFSGICSTDILPVLPGPKLDRNYLAHFLLTPDMVALASSRATGANLPRLSPRALAELRVPLPPFPEQRRIAEVLDRTEALRTKRRAALAQLDTLTQAIFLDMFGDPVANPKGWSETKLGEVVAEMQYGPRFYNEAYGDNGIRIVRITDLANSGELDFESMPRMRVSDDEKSQFELKPGDVIFARSGATVGKVALFAASDPPCIPGAYFIRMRFRDVVIPEYAVAVLATSSIRTIVESQSRQAAQQNFSGPGLKRLPMPTPPVSLQREFLERKLAIDRQRRAERIALSHLDGLFASLEHRAFRGDL